MAEKAKVPTPVGENPHPPSDNPTANALPEAKVLIVYTMCMGLPAPVVAELLKERYGLKIPATKIAQYYYAVERNAHAACPDRRHSPLHLMAWFIASQVQDDATFDTICEFMPKDLHAGDFLGVHNAYEQHKGPGGQRIRTEWYAIKAKGFEIPCEVADPGLSW